MGPLIGVLRPSVRAPSHARLTGTSSGAALYTNNLTTLNDRIEVRIDPTTNALPNTGTLANVSGVEVYSGEAAAQVGSFYAQPMPVLKARKAARAVMRPNRSWL
jgi:hypothetical protein